MRRVYAMAVAGALAVVGAPAVTGASDDPFRPTRIDARTSVDPNGRLVVEYDLEPGGNFTVELRVKLPGREPSVLMPRYLGGEVGDDVEGGAGKIIVWDAPRDRRRLTGEETAWVLVRNAGLALPAYFDGPLPGLRFAHVPAGSFRMGSPEEESGRSRNEGPVVTRALESFQMSATEINQAQYQKVMGLRPSKVRGDDRPVERVTWGEAMEFCRRLGQLDPDHTYRLPTEAEWEYACRAGTTSPFFWIPEEGEKGPAPRGAIGASPYGWHASNCGGKTGEVASKEPNAWGLYDMHGNVWEWCLDDYAEEHPGRPPSVAGLLDGARGDGERTVRGGSWLDPADKCRAAARKGVEATERKKNVGIRVVRVAAEKPLQAASRAPSAAAATDTP